jgi:cyclin A
MSQQTEVTERMRTILVDWMVDVHLKFKLHPETFFLAVDVVDRFLMTTKGSRATLQLVGVCAMLLAAKHDEIWPPEVKDCIYICANTFSRDDVLRMERQISEALQFRLTVPTVYPFLIRMCDVADANDTVRHLALYVLENAMLDYGMLSYSASHVAFAALMVAQAIFNFSTAGDTSPESCWNSTLQYYSKRSPAHLVPCATQLLESMKINSQPNSRYQAVKRKYSSQKYSQVSSMPLPDALGRN